MPDNFKDFFFYMARDQTSIVCLLGHIKCAKPRWPSWEVNCNKWQWSALF